MTVSIHHEYETVIIVRPDLDDADTYGIVERFEKVITENGGHLLLRDDWGKRRLAYLIDKHQKGHYVLFSHLSPAPLVSELERIIGNEDRVLRFMSVLLGSEVDVASRLVRAEEERKERELRAKLRAEQEQDDLDDEADPDEDDDNS
jgi:small subunit ribosomal protein S6